MNISKAKMILADNGISEQADFAYAMADNLFIVVFSIKRFIVALDEDALYFIGISVLSEKSSDEIIKIPMNSIIGIKTFGIGTRIQVSFIVDERTEEVVTFEVPKVSLGMTKAQRAFWKRIKQLENSIVIS